MGVDEGLVWHGPLELYAQLADVDVDRAVGLPEGLTPDLPVELLAADDPALAANERRQELQLPDRQLERVAARQRDKLVGSDLQGPRLEGAPVRRRGHRP